MSEREQAWWRGECDVMEIMRASCSHCRGLPDLPVSEEPRDPAPGAGSLIGRPTMFEARFDGRCAECRGVIAPGDLIARLSGGRDGRYACQECAPWAS